MRTRGWTWMRAGGGPRVRPGDRLYIVFFGRHAALVGAILDGSMVVGAVIRRYDFVGMRYPHQTLGGKPEPDAGYKTPYYDFHRCPLSEVTGYGTLGRMNERSAHPQGPNGNRGSLTLTRTPQSRISTFSLNKLF